MATVVASARPLSSPVGAAVLACAPRRVRGPILLISGRLGHRGCWQRAPRKPGTLPMEDASDTTVFKAIALSEGLAPYAAKQAYILRKEAGSSSRSEIAVDLRRIVDHKAPDVPLMANDILYVPDNLGQRNTISTLKVFSAVGLVAFSTMLSLVLR